MTRRTHQSLATSFSMQICLLLPPTSWLYFWLLKPPESPNPLNTTALHISQGGYCSTAARLLTALGGRALSVEGRAPPLTMGPPDCGLWPSAPSSLPFAPVMICQSECSSAHFQTKPWPKMLGRCLLTHSLWRKLLLGSAQERRCWVCEPLCGNNSSSHSALNARAACQIPSHEPDNDPTGWMDHVTLTL